MEDQEKPVQASEEMSISQLLSSMLPMTMLGAGALLVGMGFYFYLFPEDEQSVTALIPAFIGLGLLIPGFIVAFDVSGDFPIFTIITPENKKHVMHAGAMFALIGTLGGLMGISDFISWITDGVPLERPTIARIAMVLLCGQTLVGCIMSFRLARIKREQEAGN